MGKRALSLGSDVGARNENMVSTTIGKRNCTETTWIRIRLLDGAVLTISKLDVHSTLKQVKDRIYLSHGIYVSQQRYMYHGNLLGDKRFTEIGLPPGATIYQTTLELQYGI